MSIGKSGIICGVLYIGTAVTWPILPRPHFTQVRAIQQEVSDAIAPGQAAKLLSKGHMVILDVRSKEDCGSFVVKPCPQCITVRMETMLGTTHTEDEGVMAGELLLDQARQHPVLKRALTERTPVMVMCCKGVRSEIAQRVLKSVGFNVTHVSEGMLSRTLPDSLFRGERPIESAVEEK